MRQKQKIFNVLVSTSLLASLVLPAWVSADSTLQPAPIDIQQNNAAVQSAALTSPAVNPASVTQAVYDIVSVEAIPDSSYPYRTRAFEFSLPDKVKVQLSDGSETELYVGWSFNAYNPENGTGGTFVAEGKLRGNPWGSSLPVNISNPNHIVATANITIDAPKQVVSIAALPDVDDVLNGTSFYSLDLPREVEVTLDDHSTEIISITWDQSSYDPDQKAAHSVEFTGRLGDRYGMPVGVENKSGLLAKVKVSFKAARSITFFKPVEVGGVPYHTTKSADALGLPKEVTATLEDQKEMHVPIKWDVASSSYDPDKLEAQTFEVVGMVDGDVRGLQNPNAIIAKATVKVAKANEVTKVSAIEVAHVPNGISKTALAFYLPKQTDITLTNGDQAKVDITWDLVNSTYDPDNTQQQAIEVKGTLVHLPIGVAAPQEQLKATVQIDAMRYVDKLHSKIEITGINNGSSPTVDAFGLPKQVAVQLTDGSLINTDVQWQLSSISYDKRIKKEQTFTVSGALINLPAGVKSNTFQAVAAVKVDAQSLAVVDTNVKLSDVAVTKAGRLTTEVLGEYFLPLSGDVTGSNGQPINGPGTALMVLQMYIDNEEVRTIDYLGRSLALNTKLYVGWSNKEVLGEAANVLKAALLHHPKGKNYEVMTSESPAGIIIKQKPGSGSDEFVYLSVVDNGNGSAVEGLAWDDMQTKVAGSFGQTGMKAKFSLEVQSGANTAGNLIVHVADGAIDKQIAVAVNAQDDAAIITQKIAAQLLLDAEIAHAYMVTAEGKSLVFTALADGPKKPAISIVMPDRNNSGGTVTPPDQGGSGTTNSGDTGSTSGTGSGINGSDTSPSANKDTATDKNKDNKPSTDQGDKGANSNNNGSVEQAKSFIDLQQHKWAQKSIELLSSKGIIKGTSEQTFSPGAAMKRGDFALLLMKLLNVSAQTSTAFIDVPQNSYYAEAISSLKAEGIVQGFKGGKFNPEAAISRQDLMVMLHKALTKSGFTFKNGDSSALLRFTDAGKVQDYAKAAVLTMLAEGIVKGDGSKLNPTGMATRAEVSVMLEQVLNLLPTSSK
ncbi:Ig-like domain-containing protein [Paenibacillus sp. ACRRX]|uniref:Ig-like domain-containing protein n=1 Tax=Paenibacillus sp. ACRRX TaxID=2918206 RepID=UPI001EF540EF|nr:Ig-like domain-containing protein [Paenibacillus sp. ACRRX]MCG7406906.1 Ig-like domain-containing protein [Paenibacillus sp. ACRRX]